MEYQFPFFVGDMIKMGSTEENKVKIIAVDFILVPKKIIEYAWYFYFSGKTI